MKDETKLWLEYANENYLSSKVLLESHLYNPTLQNIQQVIEKNIKAYFIENGIKLQKTHNILSLNETLKKNHCHLNIDEDEIDLIDTIYLSSKYPFGSVLPDFEPDEKICLVCLDVLERELRMIFRRVLRMYEQS
ncbi:HEPN domain-containing protein [Sulfurimonas sp. SAG-AH-194-C21]|nr:HEPN domain-containing protein [Sulfurimonas sp. SAG-AH-194-C21]MDF1883253.1 HEPN domain-containing protein [Sulfurimonas sp. SAG-AH-194-C21]